MNGKYQLLNELAKKGQIFSFEDAARTSSLGIQSLKVMLSRMEKEGLVERIEKGKYLIIPLGARKGKYTVNEFIIGSHLIEPAVVAYWSALNYHGFTDQIPNTVFIQTTSRKKEQNMEILGVRYRIARVTKKKFFGVEKAWIEDVAVEITDPEKTVVDCLDKPHYCGGITEAAKALHGELDIEKLKKYAIDIGNSAVIKRLGILCDKMGIKIDIEPGLLSGNYPLRIKFDITKPEKERIILPLVKKAIFHPYSDDCSAVALAYSLQEIMAEKLRSVFERTRARDIYDIGYISKNTDFMQALDIFPAKCEFKKLTPDIDDLLSRRADFQNAWNSSLGHQLKNLPDFEPVFNEVVDLMNRMNYITRNFHGPSEST